VDGLREVTTTMTVTAIITVTAATTTDVRANLVAGSRGEPARVK
jgi:hypothetical protein